MHVRDVEIKVVKRQNDGEWCFYVFLRAPISHVLTGKSYLSHHFLKKNLPDFRLGRRFVSLLPRSSKADYGYQFTRVTYHFTVSMRSLFT